VPASPTAAGQPPLRELLALEARAQRWPAREVRPALGGFLVRDRDDPEPVFNRLVDPRPPSGIAERAAWLEGLDTLFDGLERRPHVWLVAEEDDPITATFRESGYEVVGRTRYMVLADAAPCRDAIARSDGVRLERIERWSADAGLAARDVAWVIGDAFGLEPALRVLVEADIVRMIDVPAIGFVLARLGDEPVATARRTIDGAGALLAAIGTRPDHRRHGYGRLVTAAAALDSVAAGGRTVFLGVEEGNEAAERLYLGLGFEFADGVVLDLLRR